MHWSGLGSSIPEQHLTRVRAADNEIRVEGREFGSEDIGLSVEDVLGSVMHMQVPDLDETVWIMRSGGVFGVRGKDELRELFSCQLAYVIGTSRNITFVENPISEIILFLLHLSSQNCAISFIRRPFLAPPEP